MEFLQRQVRYFIFMSEELLRIMETQNDIKVVLREKKRKEKRNTFCCHFISLVWPSIDAKQINWGATLSIDQMFTCHMNWPFALFINL